MHHYGLRYGRSLGFWSGSPISIRLRLEREAMSCWVLTRRALSWRVQGYALACLGTPTAQPLGAAHGLSVTLEHLGYQSGSSPATAQRQRELFQ